MTTRNGKRWAQRTLRAFAATLAGLGLISQAQANVSYTTVPTWSGNATTATGTALWSAATTWTPSTGFPGDAVNGLDDSATVIFLGSTNNQTPAMDLQAGSYTIDFLNVQESGAFNIQGNFVSTGGTAQLTLKQLNYSSGNQEIDFIGVKLVDKADSTSFIIDTTGGNTLDLAGGLEVGSDGLTTRGGGEIRIRGLQMNDGATLTSAQTGTTPVLAIDTSGGPVTKTYNLAYTDQAAAAGSQYLFTRSAGTDALTINIANITENTAKTTFRVGIGNSISNNQVSVINVNDLVDLSLSGSGNKTLTNASTGMGVLNINSGIKVNTSGTQAVLTFSGGGVTAIRNVDITNQTGGVFGSGVTLTGGNLRVDLTTNRGHTIIIDSQSRFGVGTEIRQQRGTTLGFEYDVFASGQPGVRLHNQDGQRGVGHDFIVAQSGFMDLHNNTTNNTAAAYTVRSYNHIKGNLSNATFGSTGNIRFQRDAVLGDVTNATGLTRAAIEETAGAGNLAYMALTANNQTVTGIGDDGVGIYKGVAFTGLLYNDSQAASEYAGSTNGETNPSEYRFSGTLESITGQNLNLLVTAPAIRVGNYTITPGNSATTSTPTFNASTGIVDIRGGGNLVVRTSIAGNANIFNRMGDANLDGVGINTQNNTLVQFDNNGGGAAAGETWNFTDGRLLVSNTGGVNNTATININNGATLTFGVDNPQTGTFNLNAGSAILVNRDLTPAAAVRTRSTISPGTLLLILGNDRNLNGAFFTTASTGALANGDIVIAANNANSFLGGSTVANSAGPLQIGNNRRLTTSGDRGATINNLRGSTAVNTFNNQFLTNQSGATMVMLTAASGQTLDLNVNAMFGADLVIGDGNTFMTVSNNTTTRQARAQNGTVRLDGVATNTNGVASFVTVNNIKVVNGGLRIGDDALDVVRILGDLTIDAAQNNPLFVNTIEAVILERGDIEIAGNVIVNQSGISPTDGDASRFRVRGDLSSLSNDGANSLNERLKSGTLANGADGVVVMDFGQFRMDILGEGTATPYNINQKITIDTTGPNYALGNDAHVQVVLAGPVPVGTGIVNLNNVILNANSFLRIDEGANTSVRANLTLKGDATISEHNAGANDVFDLLNVQSDAPGNARTLFLGVTTDGAAFNTTLINGNTISSDITVDITNGALTFDLDNTTTTGAKFVARNAGTLNVRKSGGTVDETVDIDNEITILNTLARTSLTYNEGAASGTDTVNFNSVKLGAGSILSIDEINTAVVRANLTLLGNATIGESDAGGDDDFSLLAIQSDGGARTLTIADIGTNANRMNLIGMSTSDITIDVAAGTFIDSVGLGGDIKGNLIVQLGATAVIDGGADTINNLTVFGTVNATGGGSLVVDGVVSGTGTINADTTVNGDINPGASPGTINFVNLTNAAGSELNFELAAGGNPVNSDLVNVTGIWTTNALVTIDIVSIGLLDEATYVLVDYGTWNGSLADLVLTESDPNLRLQDMTLVDDVVNGRLLLVVIPEPSMAALMGLAGLAALRRRRNR